MKSSDSKRVHRVLVAEDDEDDFSIFNLAISSVPGSFEILHTTDGVMFSSLIQSAMKTDVIFLDINMPYKDGFSCLKEIRNSPDYKLTRVVMYSTSSNINDIERSFDLGANFYLVKPTNFTEIVNQLEQVFNNEYFLKNLPAPRSQFVVKATNDKDTIKGIGIGYEAFAARC